MTTALLDPLTKSRSANEPFAGKVRMTLAEFEALPENDSVDRELIAGVLKERTMTRRNRFHAKTEANIA